MDDIMQINSKVHCTLSPYHEHVSDANPNSPRLGCTSRRFTSVCLKGVQSERPQHATWCKNNKHLFAVLLKETRSQLRLFLRMGFVIGNANLRCSILWFFCQNFVKVVCCQFELQNAAAQRSLVLNRFHDGLLPGIYNSLFQRWSLVPKYNTRYATNQNYFNPSVYTNIGKK